MSLVGYSPGVAESWTRLSDGAHRESILCMLCFFPILSWQLLPKGDFHMRNAPIWPQWALSIHCLAFSKQQKKKKNLCVCVCNEKQEYFMMSGIIHKDSDKWLVLYNICILHPPPKKNKLIHIVDYCKFRTSKFLKLTLSFHIFLVLFFPPSPISGLPVSS